MSPSSINRVFPIRSAVSIDPAATPMIQNEPATGFPGFNPASQRRASKTSASGASVAPSSNPRDHDISDNDTGSDTVRGIQLPSDPIYADPNRRFMADRLNSLAAATKDDASQRSDNVSIASAGASVRSAPDTPLITARFKHVVTEGGHAVITGRDGETLQRCEDEPIHIPGAIQSFGLLVVLKEEGDKLVVRVVSENSRRVIGYTPQQLFTLSSFLDIFTEEQADNLMDHLDFIRDEDAGDVESNGPEVFILSIRPPGHRTRKLWCAMHLSDSDRGQVICEFEIEDDLTNPLVPPSESQTPDIPEDTLGSAPTQDEFNDSTVNISRPLRVLRGARKKRTEAAAMEVFNIMSQVQEQLSSAPTLAIFLKVLIGIVKELTGFHRVMIYQFDQAWNGRVVAELVDPRATKDLYKGLNFPASDIPKQARDLYKVNKVRLLYDRDQETARLVCRTMDDLEKPVDLTHANLRAMSPIHLKYLANMAVRSSMSISINAFNELWGLIACHSYGNKGMRVSFPIRKMCRLVGDTASRNIERLSYASRLQARKLINTTSSNTNPSGYIVASSEDLLKLFNADVGALSIRDETKILGNPRGHLQEVLAMVEFFRMRGMSSVFSTQDIALDFPDLRYGPGMKFLAGVLFVPLSGGGDDFIVFFRGGVLQEVKWAGNPYEKFVKEGTEGYLEPRTSFKAWSETIVGRCRDWTDDEMETAAVLCLVYGKFIDVWRQKEAALQTSQLTRLLLANSAHEVRTPLNAIINYLEIAMEGTLDHETRENLAKSHSASKSLVYVINDLLDLTKAEGGQSLVKEEPFDLIQALKEATDPFSGDSKRKNLQYDISFSKDLPSKVIGDHRRVRQVVSNLIANAFQHTSEGRVSVEASVSSMPQAPGKVEIEIVVDDTGKGMNSGKVDALFRELEEVSYEEDLQDQPQILPRDPFSEQASAEQMLGLGLAVVARTVRHMNGQLRLRTEEGKGSCFTIVLTFDTNIPGTPLLEGPPSMSSSHPKPMAPKQVENEVTLVYRAPQGPVSAPPPMLRKHSGDSMNSMQSLKSGKSGASFRSDTSQKSDAERLIDAIQEPLRLFGEKSPGAEAPGPPKRATLDYTATPSTPSRKSTSTKAMSLPSPRDLRSSMHNVPGARKVIDSGMPLRPVRVADDDIDRATSSKSGPKVAFSEEPDTISAPSDTTDGDSVLSPDHFSILVAEDDPINSRIMKKRLEKLGHSVYMTVNGEECASAHGEQPANFDAILMDLQMPIVDGFTSTKMIRSFEKTHSTSCLSSRAQLNGRIPVFAVSASLVEAEREKYIENGFDGWILKPVDFKRVGLMLDGIVNEESRNSCLYEPGHWERGGWFLSKSKQSDFYDVDTTPSQEKPTLEFDKRHEE
jgi:light-regulated signal transduction histidine kinase (bacteriophytochrome)/CheY-like chemotaxis protein